MVTGLVPYIPGEQPKGANQTKLNTNENPYPPSPKVVAAIQAAAQQGLQLYPDPESVVLRTAIAQQYGLQRDQVFVGNSSDEVLAQAFFALFQQPGPLVLPDVTYSFYQVYCGLYGIPMHVVPLTDDLRVDVEMLVGPVGVKIAGVVIANPNAPTGIGMPLAQIERLLQMHPQHAVLVDEAYVDFGGASAVCLIDRYPNLLVTQTLSKSRSLAGLRVGLACGQRPLIEALERVKNSFNSFPLGRLAQAGALAAFEDQAYFAQTCAAVVHSREGLALQLEDMGFEVLPSQANFVFVRHPQRDAAELAAQLRARAVLVRHFKQPRIRVPVGRHPHHPA